MPRPPQIEDLYAVVKPQQPAIAPDGGRVVYVRTSVLREEDRPHSELWEVGTDGSSPRRLTSGPADSSPVFSPDGSQVAFLRAADGPPQIWLLPCAGGDARQLTHLEWGAGEPVWSPDAAHIAFSAAVSPVGLAPGETASAPVVARDLFYQADGAGFIGGVRQHVHTVQVATGEVTQLTSGELHANAPVWAPDGRSVVFATGVGPDNDMTMTTTAHVVGLDRAGEAHQLPGIDRAYEVPVAFSPGGQLLCLGSAEPGSGHAELWLRSLDGTGRQDLTASIDRNVMAGAPGYPGATPAMLTEADLLVCFRDRGYTHLYRLREGQEPEVVIGGTTTVAGMSLTPDGQRAALVLATPESFGEVALLDLATGKVQELTDHRAALLADLDWVTPQERTFTAPDGTEIHGWLLRRPDVDGAGPLLLDIHGGPHNAWSGAADAEHLYHQVLAAAGWGVLLLNPRGSDGYGEAFYTAAVGSWGVADADDFLAPLDALVAEGVADPDRLAVTGYSYGGYMTCYLTSRDNRFAAAAPGGIVSDGRSVATTSDMGYFLAHLEMGALPWTDGEHLDQSSPIHLVDQVHTPTLILQGADDVRCPVSEAQRWFGSLRTRHVPSELVLYPGAAHLFILNGRPSHRADYNRRIVDWVHRHTCGADPVAPALEADHWEHRLSVLADRHEVPGAVLGILRLGAAPDGSDEVVAAAHGVLSRTTGHSVGADSVFQIGSITKVWTATLVMQLVEEGLLDLDAPVRDVLPELRLADEDVAARVTLRHLLTHTSGIDGDIFTDTGRGDDCLERYVAGLAGAAQLHPLGETFSYCNSGFNLAGRVVEKVTGKTWDTVLRERLITPLGLTRTGTLPEEALLYDAALGHERGEDQHVQPASVWGIPRSSGPAGLIHARVRDLLEFAAAHLRGGVGVDGTRILGTEQVRAMQEEQVRLPGRYDLGDSWGLGWIRFDWNGERLIGHDGNTIGQSAFLRVLPRAGVVVALLTNGGNTADLFRSLYGEIFHELADVELPAALRPRTGEVNLADASGTYERGAERIEIHQVDGARTLTSTDRHPLTEERDPVQAFELHPFDERTALIQAPAQQTWAPVTFYRAAGRRYVHHHLRATPEVVNEG
ncbi:serine hydrolase [Ornithinimicrobium pratense]|uniref:Serine hydrolase n=1 Tax=Ornithinimicrobium pratense TaxID=2593973 RepID=A0A5J6V5M8_9MICO|nr:serine hydrolase [Ornithinimicrobium pratense]QFG68451.1 serine hydrolase [Ornithinimicrobium pratense]